MPTKPEREKAKKYFDLCNDNFYNIGRIGAYNYRYDIDDAIEQAIAITKNL
jgi:UDP-galactopyranose mutase